MIAAHLILSGAFEQYSALQSLWRAAARGEQPGITETRGRASAPPPSVGDLNVDPLLVHVQQRLPR
jgi:hypothetical protein